MKALLGCFGAAVLLIFAIGAATPDKTSNTTWQFMGTPEAWFIPSNRPFVTSEHGCKRFTDEAENYLFSVCSFGVSHWKRIK